MHVQVKLTAHTLGQRLAMGNNQAVRVAMIMMATGLVALAALVASDLGSTARFFYLFFSFFVDPLRTIHIFDARNVELD